MEPCELYPPPPKKGSFWERMWRTVTSSEAKYVMQISFPVVILNLILTAAVVALVVGYFLP